MMIPAIMAKTTAFFVDDKREFLDDLNELLPKTHYFKTFTNPLEALGSIKLNNQPCFTRQESLLRDFKSVQFETIVSVIVVDYRMKPINGIEFCRQIGPQSPKRIMLTSQATEDLAVKAFNNKWIDAFLLKTEDNLLETLSSTMQKCTIEFFNEMSTGINGFKTKCNPLMNNAFTEFFFNFCTDNKIESHCCFHDFHNIVMKDNHGKETYMTIYDDGHLNDLLASEQAGSAKPHIIDHILTRQAAPCFKETESALIPDGTVWEKFMVPLTPIKPDLFIAIS